MKCIICHEREAEVPDRNYGGIGRPIKKLCKECHSELLKEDLKEILKNVKTKSID